MASFSSSCAHLSSFSFAMTTRVTPTSFDIGDQLKYFLLKYHDLHMYEQCG